MIDENNPYPLNDSRDTPNHSFEFQYLLTYIIVNGGYFLVI